MSAEDAPPEPDRVGDAPHPRETVRLFGQDAAERAFLGAWASGRMHHAWLLTGPRGVGKATLAWRIARFLLARPAQAADAGLFGEAPPGPDTLDVDAADPVARRLLALGEPRLLLLRRGWDEKIKRLKYEITVNESRKLGGFLGLTAADGGARVVIVDSADDLNPNAANAILKLLEEPPRNVVFLLVSHQPARLLPTIRSRCRVLALRRLEPDALSAAVAQAGFDPGPDAAALAELSDGSAGMAVRLLEGEGLGLYADLLAAIGSAPRMDRTAALALADHMGARGKADRQEMGVYLIGLLLSRLARTGAGHPPAAEAAPGELEVLHRLAPGPGAARGWATLQSDLGDRLGRGLAVNLDPPTLILDTLVRINEAAGSNTVRA